jgi:hypothetical protein
MGYILEVLDAQKKDMNVIRSLIKDFRNGIYEPLYEHGKKFILSQFEEDTVKDIDVFRRGECRCQGDEEEIYFEIRPKGYEPKSEKLIVSVLYNMNKHTPSLRCGEESYSPFSKMMNTLLNGDFWSL